MKKILLITALVVGLVATSASAAMIDLGNDDYGCAWSAEYKGSHVSQKGVAYDIYAILVDVSKAPPDARAYYKVNAKTQVVGFLRYVSCTKAMWCQVRQMEFGATVNEVISDTGIPEITGPRVRVVPRRITGEGVGIVVAMRGTLTHHYTCDANGICTGANLIVGTTNNIAPIQMVKKKVAQPLIRPGKEPDAGILNMVEMAFRAFDPCFSCATHSLPGQMPLDIRIYRGGQLHRRFTR